MKKKIIGFVMFAAIAVAAGWNVYQCEKKITLSDLGLANVEALAGGEGKTPKLVNCREGKITGDPYIGNMHWICGACEYRLSYDLGNRATCTYYY
ncbi:hypothetical protein M2480_002371 [Parabacteroides sp. PFB2-12]|uniref:NVEALA domain-containing protein n=1 Tax=unclassified Parabacteroides TaxID=2649774 RepID=UPI0024753705|nr:MULTISPECIES: NVEALA domain-containing protein [unclassified Parabacteroides]MDH6343643.1 hypothetical protein [Parabacteroides sp. PM6-13]MDH6391376.1 hypothetical protein [Parabacteroides sp. PFB2-12]